MVTLLYKNNQTDFCKFSIDSESDINSLPTKTNPGKYNLSTISKCSQGSIAYSTDGSTYILSGEKNKWIQYNSNTSSGSGSTNDIQSISDAFIESLFN